MTEDEVLAYVGAAARVLDLSLDPARTQAVAAHFARTAAMARLLQVAPLAPEDEPAEIFLPAPFPQDGSA